MTKLGLTLVLFVTIGVARSQTLADGRLVFAANSSGNWDLYLLDHGAVRPEQLTKTALDERGPALSPDRRRVAYTDSSGALWVMNLADRSTQKLGDHFATGHYGYPAWLDNERIVYTVYDFKPWGEDADLYFHSFRDGRSGLLVKQTGPQDFAAVSPSGDRIAYMSTVITLVAGSTGTMTHQLWTVSLGTGKPQQLFFGSARDTRPSWSPNGKTLAFSSDRSGNTEIWTVAVDAGSVPTQVTTGPGAKSSPTWSPAGDQIAYVNATSRGSRLVLLNVGSKQSTDLPLFEGMRAEISDPSWR